MKAVIQPFEFGVRSSECGVAASPVTEGLDSALRAPPLILAGAGDEFSRQQMSQRDGKELAVQLHRFAAVIGQHAGSTRGRAVREGA